MCLLEWGVRVWIIGDHVVYVIVTHGIVMYIVIIHGIVIYIVTIHGIVIYIVIIHGCIVHVISFSIMTNHHAIQNKQNSASEDS